ncbi:MAG: hypothetical protein AB7O65_09140 [Candidatus Korobacteraceae bacterium]
MKKLASFEIVLLPTEKLAVAQAEVPKYEAYLAHSFTRVNSAINVSAFSANGRLGEFVYNITDVIGVVASFNAVHNDNSGGVRLDQTMVGYNLGPRSVCDVAGGCRSWRCCSVQHPCIAALRCQPPW